MTNQSEVIIVGAGPTGLALANELALAGIDCRIVERRRQESNLTRAFAVHARTLELLDARGLAEEVIRRGVQLVEVQGIPGPVPGAIGVLVIGAQPLTSVGMPRPLGQLLADRLQGPPGLSLFVAAPLHVVVPRLPLVLRSLTPHVAQLLSTPRPTMVNLPGAAPPTHYRRRLSGSRGALVFHPNRKNAARPSFWGEH